MTRWIGLPLPFNNTISRGNHAFFKVIDLFWRLLRYPLHVFAVTAPVSKKKCVSRTCFFFWGGGGRGAHYAICRYVFTAGFQYNYRQITASFSTGRRKQLLLSNRLLFCCSWFKFNFAFNSSVVDCVSREFTKPRRQRQRERHWAKE